MKSLFKILLLPVVVLGVLSCNTDIENVGYTESYKHIEPDWDAIRAYKASDHEIMFGWFGGWNGGGVSMVGALSSLPDSMDMVSIWGEWVNVSDRQVADMKYVQTVKGTKVLACIFTPSIGRHLTPEGVTDAEYWGFTPGNRDSEIDAVVRYADALAQFVLGLGYDGVDIDNEPEGGNAIYGKEYLFHPFVETLGKYMGPKSGTDKIFALDGSLTAGMKRGAEGTYQYFNYFIDQSYNSGANFDGTVRNLAGYSAMTFDDAAKKFICTCSFELSAHTGGGAVTFDGVSVPRMWGFARWQPTNAEGLKVPKGGTGAYHIENDYRNSTDDYYYTRQAIWYMNNHPVPETN